MIAALCIFTGCTKKEDNPPSENTSGAFTWKENISVQDIPNTPVKGMIDGVETPIQYVNFEHWRGSGDNVINFSSKAPKQNCGFVENDNAFHFTKKSGEIEKGEILKSNFDAALDGYVADYHISKGTDDIQKTDAPYNAALVITEMTESVVKGKIAVCFNDKNKSWIAGTFEAIRCNN